MSQEKVLTDANFETEVLKCDKPVLVDFWAEWCGPCKMLTPVVARIAETYKDRVVVGKVNVDDNPHTAQKYGIQGIPTLLFFKGGSAVERMVGFQSQDNIQRVINEALLEN
jgi:thioredoxin 1